MENSSSPFEGKLTPLWGLRRDAFPRGAVLKPSRGALPSLSHPRHASTGRENATDHKARVARSDAARRLSCGGERDPAYRMRVVWWCDDNTLDGSGRR